MSSKNIVYALDHVSPDWRFSYLPSDILILCIDYLAEEKTVYNDKKQERVNSTCFFIDGNKYGESTFYWDVSMKQSIMSRGMYINNSKHGEWLCWGRNGLIEQRAFFNGGYLHGEYKTYWPDGQPHIFSSYVKGKLHGKYMYWWNNGVLLFDGQHVDNQRNGRWKEYNPSGVLTFDGLYKNGDKVIP